jgi:hypothetical protein
MMEIKGRLIRKLPVQTGQGRNGEWKKQEFILEMEGTYPKKVCVSVWGDKVNMASFDEGSMLTASIDIESREFNGKWYTNVTAWKVEAANNEPQNIPPMPPVDTYQSDMDSPPVQDDLPF